MAEEAKQEIEIEKKVMLEEEEEEDEIEKVDLDEPIENEVSIEDLWAEAEMPSDDDEEVQNAKKDVIKRFESKFHPSKELAQKFIERIKNFSGDQVNRLNDDMLQKLHDILNK